MNIIKPTEAAFFSYCMKYLSFTDLLPQLDWKYIEEYSKKHCVSIKLLYSFISKWGQKGMASTYELITFNPGMFPMEYIMLIPRKVMRTTRICPMHVDDAQVIERFEEAYKIKSLQCGEQITSLESDRNKYMEKKKLSLALYNENSVLNLLHDLDKLPLHIVSPLRYYMADIMSAIVDIANTMQFDSNNAHLFNETLRVLRRFVDMYTEKDDIYNRVNECIQNMYRLVDNE